MCIYSLTDYMLLVSVIETFIVTVPLYICIFISLWLLMAAACVGGYEWRMKKMIVNRSSMLVERQCIIY